VSVGRDSSTCRLSGNEKKGRGLRLLVRDWKLKGSVLNASGWKEKDWKENECT